jgi:hypothetical protein
MISIEYDNYFPTDGKLIHAYKTRKDTFSNLESLESIDGSNDFVVPMFAVPLVHIQIKDWKNKKSRLLQIYKNTQTNSSSGSSLDVDTDYHYNNRTNSSYSQDIHNILCDEIAIMENMLLHPNDFHEVNIEYPIDCEDEEIEFYFKLENSWFEKTEKNKRHDVHNHGPVGYSCVVFIDYDPNIHTPTRFYNPYFSSFFGTPCDYQPRHLVNEGSLICFPSPILHSTDPNISDKDRLILSWNMSVVDKFNQRVLA